MNDYEKAKECLKIIEQHGDLYDVIAQKEGVRIEKETSTIPNVIRANILLFSRILYGGVILYDKIKSFFSPIQKVKEANEKIRELLGVNVDIIRPKSSTWLGGDAMGLTHIKACLAILYENDKSNTKEYVSSLKKMLRFSELHQLKIIFLKETDIISLFSGVYLDDYLHVSRKNILYCSKKGLNFNDVEDTYNLREELTSEFLCLDVKELKELIEKLETLKIDKKRVLTLSENIHDVVIQKTIAQFLLNDNLKLLKNIVKERLLNVLNSNTSYRDSRYGKVFKKIEIKGKYVNVVSMNSKGEVIEQFVTTLYDYLEVLDYPHLLKKASFKNDEQEMMQISALYLYLFQEMKNDKMKNSNGTSFYDYVLKKYEEKHKRKNVPGLYTEKEKLMNTICRIFFGCSVSAILMLSILLGATTIDIVKHYCFGREQTVYENVLETIITPYVKSAQFELKLGKKVFGKIRNFLPELDSNESIKNLSKNPFSMVKTTGDVDTFGDEKEVIATVFPLSLNEPMPKYFATEYACFGNYDKGSVDYSSMMDRIHFSEVEQVETLFKIQYTITKEELSSAILEMQYSDFLWKQIYPVGDNYVITNIIVSDEKDPSKKVEIYREGDQVFADSERVETLYDVLNSIENPQVCITYGVSKVHQNSFAKNMVKFSYTKGEYSDVEIRNAIIKGLGLKESATNEEAFEAIRNKLYSLTPIADANLSSKIKELTEIEFYETIASLDSLVCNLSAMLATGVDDELIYTFGYYSSDNEITSNEKHAWTMNKKGEIIDVTPSEEVTENDLIINVLNYGRQYHIPATLLIAFASYINYKLFGKKLKFMIASKKLEQTLENEYFNEAYAKLKETIYGGIHVPVSRNLSETVKIIDEEFSSYTIEELKDLKKELKQILDKEDYHISSKLINQIPFVKEYNEEIQKVFQKRKEK